MKISGNAVRPGMVVEHQNRLWRAVKIQHTQPGKGGAYLQVELKDLRSGTKLNERFRSSETVEQVQLDYKDYQYLYTDGETYTFMDTETFEQISLGNDLLSEDQVPFLQENMVVKVESYEGAPVTVRLPEHVTLTVAEADPTIKGQTAASSYKSATLENGIKLQVPPFISTGERIVVNTSEGTYVERAKD
jgi:elongation factor P